MPFSHSDHSSSRTSPNDFVLHTIQQMDLYIPQFAGKGQPAWTHLAIACLHPVSSTRVFDGGSSFHKRLESKPFRVGKKSHKNFPALRPVGEVSAPLPASSSPPNAEGVGWSVQILCAPRWRREVRRASCQQAIPAEPVTGPAGW